MQLTQTPLYSSSARTKCSFELDRFRVQEAGRARQHGLISTGATKNITWTCLDSCPLQKIQSLKVEGCIGVLTKSCYYVWTFTVLKN